MTGLIIAVSACCVAAAACGIVVALGTLAKEVRRPNSTISDYLCNERRGASETLPGETIWQGGAMSEQHKLGDICECLHSTLACIAEPSRPPEPDYLRLRSQAPGQQGAAVRAPCRC